MSTAMEIYGTFGFLLALTICPVNSMPSSRKARLTLVEPMPYYYRNDIDGHPGTYSYGYDVQDPVTGNSQFRTEERYPNGTVIGSYGYVDAWGTPHRYRYIADGKGYRVSRDPPYNPYRDPVMQFPSQPSFQPAQPARPSDPYPAQTSVTWTRPKKPEVTQLPTYSNMYPSQAVTWTRPKKPNNKRKNNVYYVNRPSYNFIGPPSSYAED